MEWHKEDVRWAFKLYMQLLQRGVIDENDRDLHFAYNRNEVRQIIEEIIEEEADVKIFAFGNNIYLTPGINNRYLGYTNEELRNEMKLKNNSELYLAYFLILCLLAKFYNSEDQNFASRQFVLVRDLEETVTDYVEAVTLSSEEAVESFEELYQINLSSVAESWQEQAAFDDQLVQLKRGKNRIGFILRVMSFLEKEGLVQIFEEQEIRLLPKIEHLVLKYYFNSERKEMLLNILSKPLDFEENKGVIILAAD